MAIFVSAAQIGAAVGLHRCSVSRLAHQGVIPLPDLHHSQQRSRWKWSPEIAAEVIATLQQHLNRWEVKP